MPHVYPLKAKVISEFVGMTLTIFMGESILANELLTGTKGHGMGLLAVSIGFGLAFGVNIAWFSFISAHLNPAMFFFLAILGKVSWEEFICCALADFAGAFLGAVLVIIFFGPHFGYNLPLPSNVSDAATCLEGPVSLDKDAGRIASAFGPSSRKAKGATIGQELRGAIPGKFHDIEYFRLHESDGIEDGHSLNDPETKALLLKMEVQHRRRVKQTHAVRKPILDSITENQSIQVAELLHNKDSPLLEALLRESASNARHSVQVAGLLHTKDKDIANGEGTEVVNNTSSGQTSSGLTEAEGETAGTNGKDVEAQAEEEERKRQEEQEKQEEAMACYRAALKADASAKLAVFATRPAIFNRPYNYLQEAILTAMLVMGAELFNLRREMQGEITGEELPSGPFFQSFYVAMFIAMLILGLGGVTGLAANPARDLGPRLAHWLMPIPGKGSSEWEYGLIVPLFGPLTGSAIGAGIFMGCEAMYNMVEMIEETGANVTHVEL